MGRRRVSLGTFAWFTALAFIAAFASSCRNPVGEILRDTVTNVLQSRMPHITLTIAGETYSSGDLYEFPVTLLDEQQDVVFTITNTGETELVFAGSPPVALQDVLREGAFSVLNQPYSKISPGNQSTFRVGFEPAEVGTYQSELSIESNDESNTPFLLILSGLGVRAGTLTWPNGGGALKVGQEYDIRWTAFGGGGNIRLDLYKGGVLDSTIHTGADDGHQSWTVPSGLAQGADYRIRLTSLTSGEHDESDSDFAIGDVENVSVIGSGIYRSGESRTITWSSGLGGTVAIDLYRNGELERSVTSAATNNGSYNWTIPTLTASSQYQIRVRSNLNADIWAQSTSFAVGTISNVAPTGGAYEPNGSCIISWSSVIGGTVNIELYRAGEVVQSIVSGAENDDGSHDSWSVPELNNTGYTIRVTSVENAGISAESATPFAIGTITVSAPIENSQFIRGLGSSVAWSSVIGGHVHIDLYKSGSPVRRIVSNKINGAPFTHDWVIDADEEIGEYRIRVIAASNGNVYGESASFRIGGWDDYGRAIQRITVGGEDTHDLAIGAGGVPYVFSTDFITGSGVSTVRRWEGGYGASAAWSSYDAIASVSPFGLKFAATPGFGAEDLRVVYRTSSGAVPYSRRSTSQPVWQDAVQVRTTAMNSRFDVTADFGMPFLVGYSAYADLVTYQFNGSSWPVRGVLFDYAAYIAANPGQPFTDYTPSIAVGSDSRPLVAFTHRDGSQYPIRVMKYSSGTSWSTLPSPAQDSETPDIAVRSDNNPVVAFRDKSLNRLHVVQYNGSSWVDLGYPSGSNNGYDPEIVTGSGDVPIVAFRMDGGSLSGHIMVMRYVSGTGSGAVWEDLGHRSATPATAWVHMKLDPADSMPVTIYDEWQVIGGEPYNWVQVKKFRTH